MGQGRLGSGQWDGVDGGRWRPVGEKRVGRESRLEGRCLRRAWMWRVRSQSTPTPTAVTTGGRAAVARVSGKSREASRCSNFPNILTIFSQNQTALDPDSEGEAPAMLP